MHSNVNYIVQLNQASTRLVQTPNIAPYHLSLYLVLFRYWNLNKFRNPLSVARIETMYDAKIGSKSTYYKALRDLEQLGYLKYHPSKNPAVGSKVYMTIFESSAGSTDNHLLDNTGTDLNHHKDKTSTDLGHQMGTSIKNKNNKYLNNKEEKYSPSLDEIEKFFFENKMDRMGAEKFFNYYESINWTIGGKAKITNWESAARNWILREREYENKEKKKSNYLHVNNDKDYSMPL